MSFKSAINRELFRQAEDIMERARRTPAPVATLPGGDMVRVADGRLQRHDSLLGWVDVCAVEEVDNEAE